MQRSRVVLAVQLAVRAGLAALLSVGVAQYFGLNLIQPLITMDFWETELAKFGPVWDELLATLKVGIQLPERPPAQWN